MIKSIKLGGKYIGEGHPSFIIAEAGVNHNGKIELARKLIDAAVEAGADAIKFQTFNADMLVSKLAPKADYQKCGLKKKETQYEMIKRLELNAAAHDKLITYCKKRKIIFLSSPFDLDSIDLLNTLGLKIFKIPSGELTNTPYLKKIGSLGIRVILSTGMADLREIRYALNILVSSGTRKEDIVILHCNTEYPVPLERVNLAAMITIKKTFKMNVGFSDHTQGIEVPIAAVALGASVIEKHFTLDKNMDGPDHKASANPDELKLMIKSIRNVERALGSGVKRPTKEEDEMKKIVRKSVIAKTDINRGDKIGSGMLTVKRPGFGIAPEFLGSLIGKRALREIKKDDLILLKDLK